MTEEEYFRKNYPDSCYGDKPLSPYWDFFQDGVEFGERESEEKIEELEKRVWRQKKKMVEKTKKISDLEKELKKRKDEWQEQVQKATDEGYARTLQTMQLSKAKEIIKNLMVYVPVDLKEYEEAKQFLKDKTEQEEPYYVIVNMNCQYEICRKCPKSGLFKGTYEECENWIKEKLSEVEK